ncbi:MAG: hypothetical protein OEZ35_02645 [Candidatus Bathyarchaeota archaeon]|nr:hypothetical protein [Candidatus Bathyarchaeota archaeon]
MPRRLPEKTKTTSRRPGFRRAGYQSKVFQEIPVKEGQEIDVVIDNIVRKSLSRKKQL